MAANQSLGFEAFVGELGELSSIEDTKKRGGSGEGRGSEGMVAGLGDVVLWRGGDVMSISEHVV